MVKQIGKMTDKGNGRVKLDIAVNLTWHSPQLIIDHFGKDQT
jgi:hypothetical protein